MVNRHVVTGHTLDRESFFKDCSEQSSVQIAERFYRLKSLVDAFHNESGDPILDYFRDSRAIKGDHRSTTCHGLDHHQTKGLRPVDREQQCSSIAEELGLVMFIYLAEEFHIWLGSDERCDDVLPIGFILLVYFSGDLQRHASAAGDLDRSFGTFLRRNPAEKREIVTRWMHGKRQ